MPDGGVNVLSGLHDPLFRHFFESSSQNHCVQAAKATRHWLFLLATRRFNAHRISKSSFHCVIRAKKLKHREKTRHGSAGRARLLAAVVDVALFEFKLEYRIDLIVELNGRQA
ncbi:hypothetical protein KCP69_07375 [Salmonella enterica subsp. enterica]|nr:hypothetical protein KCP69_07375 [Salmonella enterica subsp. enterica]